MRALALITTTLVLASGCMLVFDGSGHGDDVVCADGAPEIAVAPQRNPETLQCQGFGFPCDPACGPCPLSDQPVPSWGFCGSVCEDRSEFDCAASPECRVVKDAACAIQKNCLTDFLGCFPTDQAVDATIDCLAARDGATCSRSPACTAFHQRAAGTPGSKNFATCAPEGKSPGTCHGQVICLRPAPVCPSGQTPAIDNGCYTGACLPLGVCEPATMM